MEPPDFSAGTLMLRCTATNLLGLLVVKQPHGPDLTVEWGDGSGLTMKTPIGRTAFFSSVQLYDLLTEDEKKLVDHSWVEYAPHPFKWIEWCKARNTGLGIAGGGHLTEEELPEYDPAKVKKVCLCNILST